MHCYRFLSNESLFMRVPFDVIVYQFLSTTGIIKQLKAGKSCKTCLTNHTRSISHHITSLVINALRGGHTQTDTQTQTHTHTNMQTKAISKTQRVQACSLHASGLKSQSTVCRNNCPNFLLFLACTHKTVNMPGSSECHSYIMHKL